MDVEEARRVTIRLAIGHMLLCDMTMPSLSTAWHSCSALKTPNCWQKWALLPYMQEALQMLQRHTWRCPELTMAVGLRKRPTAWNEWLRLLWRRVTERLSWLPSAGCAKRRQAGR